MAKKPHGTAFSVGQFAEAGAAIHRALPKALVGLDPKKVLEAVKRGEELERVLQNALEPFVNGQPQAASVATTSSPKPTTPTPIPDSITFEVADEDTDELPQGWELVKDESVVESNGPVTLEEYGFHEEGEDYVGGEVMLARAKEGGRLGLRAARALERQQHLIPKSWRGKVLVFAGTVVLDRCGYREVACLVWCGRRWHLDWRWLGGDWDRGYRLVRSRT